MIVPPKKLADQTIQAYLRCRDADIHRLPPYRQASFLARAQKLFGRLTKAMQCTPEESWMVSENIGRTMQTTPPSIHPPK